MVNLFHIGILGIFCHLFEMLTPILDVCPFLPIAVKTADGDDPFGGVCGVVLTLTAARGLLRRRSTNQRVRATSTTPGYYHHEHFADSVSAWPEHHSVFGAISGWQRNDEVAAGAQYCCHLPRRVFEMLNGVARLFSALIWCWE